jgi:multicomponent Na+:H+ antiporter subunit C
MDALFQIIAAKANYWIYIVLMMIGLWAMIVKRNLIKKIIGMNILQTAIILFYVSISSKKGATLPILEVDSHAGGHHAVHAVDYLNPLPHVLMLTAIVVSVATLGVALALAINIYRQYGTLEEDEIAERIRG